MTARAVLLLFLGSLGGCATVSDVVPTGPNTFMVGSTVRGGFTGDAEVKALALRRAGEFCSGMGKKMVMLGSTSSGVQGWTPQNSEVNFRCE